jgi:hypothetical protein
LLGLSKMPHPQREGGAFEHLGARMVVSAADGWERRMLRHGPITRCPSESLPPPSVQE